MKITWIYGKHSAIEALKNKNRIIHEVRCIDALRDLVKSIRPGIRLTKATPEELHRITRGIHQGIAVCADPISIEKKIPKLDVSRVLVLDHLQDINNIGGIMRSMVAFGFTCLITNQRGMSNLEQCGIKSASGAMEHLQLIQIVNIRMAIIELKKQDFFCIALDHNGTHTVEPRDRIALVMGSEDEGIGYLVRKECNQIFRLSTNPDFPVLNVSVAAGIAMHTFTNYSY
jgi:23S rRNA (guanosine2251-2'-O)-methyltransferase